MNSAVLSKLRSETASELCARFGMGEAARKLLKETDGPAEFFDALVAEKQWPEAVRLLAHLMSKREAVAWAADCARQALPAEPAEPAPKALAALEAAEAWVKEASEENRRAAQAASEAAGLEHPAACAALAAFFSGGSIAPPNVPAVPPGEFLTAHAVAGGVLMAGVASEPEKAAEKYQRFLKRGLEMIGKMEAAKLASVTSAATPATAPATVPAPAAPVAPAGQRPTMGVRYGNARGQGR